MVENPNLKCAACGGSNLQFGSGARGKFVPRGSMMLMGYTVINFVCMDCCYVGHCLSREDVEDIRQNNSKRKNKA